MQPIEGIRSNRKDERGITLLLVAISLVVIIGMAALAIDVVTLYVARTETQRAADAAALAGVKAIADTGFTSGLSFANPADVCGTGTNGAANQQAIAAATKNFVAGQAPTVLSVSCNLNTVQNPTITVTVQRTGLPTFFSRIWGYTGNSVSATATAEAYNPSGQTAAPPISVNSVKPLLIPNCDPNGGTGFVGCTFFFKGAGNPINPASNYIDTPTPYHFTQGAINMGTGAPANKYLAADMSSMPATVCPGTSAIPSGSCSRAGGGGLYDDIACGNTHAISCGDTLNIDSSGTGGMVDMPDAGQGIQCLIHASTATTTNITCSSPNTTYDQDCFLPGPPATIQGGISNPNPLLRSQPNISRSDSVVTVPVYDSTNNPCPSGTCGPVTVIGFLQLGIQDVDATGGFHAYVLNAAGCGTNGTTGVSGGGVSPIPVRLIHN
jgi:hypothetical protein